MAAIRQNNINQKEEKYQQKGKDNEQ